MFQTKGIITERPDECLGCGIQVVGEADATDPVDQVSLSYIPYNNKNTRINIIPDESPSSDVDVVPFPNENTYYAWSYQNGSLCGITFNKVDPLATKAKKTKIDKDTGQLVEDTTSVTRGVIKGLSKRSRNRMIELCASIDKLGINEKDILFLTLTYGYDLQADEFHVSKKHINHFNITLKRLIDSGVLKNTNNEVSTLEEMFWIWRIEEQESGRLHFHVCIFGTRYIDSDWIRSTWEKITGEKGRIHIDNAKNWGDTQKYFSKTLAYLTKNETLDDVEIGRHYGLVNKKGLEKNRRLNVRKISKDTYYKLRRSLYKLIKVTNQRKGLWNKKYSKWVKRWIYGTSKLTHKRFIEEDVFNKLVELYI